MIGQAIQYYRVQHDTHYHYQYKVSLSQQLLHLVPRNFAYQSCLSQHIEITPASADWIAHVDYFGNPTRHITLTTMHNALVVKACSTVALSERPSMAQIHSSPAWESLPAALLHAHAADSAPYHFLFESPHVRLSPALRTYALSCFAPGRPVLEAVMALTEQIYHDFEFDPTATTIATPLSELMRDRRGVCQDFAHLMIGCLRCLGLACRYVSGYLLTTPPAGQTRLIGADASHAWVSVFVPSAGWIDFDPTNCCLVQDEHITLGWGRDFSDVTPLRGIVLGGGEQKLDVKVTVTPIPPPAA
jgi:transglutaminase-like putative cysteine protease